MEDNCIVDAGFHVLTSPGDKAAVPALPSRRAAAACHRSMRHHGMCEVLGQTSECLAKEGSSHPNISYIQGQSNRLVWMSLFARRRHLEGLAPVRELTQVTSLSHLTTLVHSHCSQQTDPRHGSALSARLMTCRASCVEDNRRI